MQNYEKKLQNGSPMTKDSPIKKTPKKKNDATNKLADPCSPIDKSSSFWLDPSEVEYDVKLMKPGDGNASLRIKGKKMRYNESLKIYECSVRVKSRVDHLFDVCILSPSGYLKTEQTTEEWIDG